MDLFRDFRWDSALLLAVLAFLTYWTIEGRKQSLAHGAWLRDKQLEFGTAVVLEARKVLETLRELVAVLTQIGDETREDSSLLEPVMAERAERRRTARDAVEKAVQELRSSAAGLRLVTGTAWVNVDLFDSFVTVAKSLTLEDAKTNRDRAQEALNDLEASLAALVQNTGRPDRTWRWRTRHPVKAARRGFRTWWNA